MVIDRYFTIIHLVALLVVGAALLLFLVSTRIQHGKHTRRVRVITAALGGSAIVVLLFATSPFQFDAPAPTPLSAQIVALKNDDQLVTLRVADGDLHFPSASIPRPFRTNQLNHITFIHNGVVDIQIANGDYSQDFHLPGGSALAANPPDGEPVIVGNVAYYSASAVNLLTQTTIWSQSHVPRVRADPIGVENNILYVETGAEIVALRVTDGAILWSFNFSAQFPEVDSYHFMLYSGAVYISGRQGENVAVIKVADGTMMWRLPSAIAVAADGNRLYIETPVPHEAGGPLAAVDIRTGQTIWQLPSAGHPNAIHVAPTFSRGSPTSSIQNIAIVNGILYFAGIDESAGEASDACVVVAMRGNDGTQLWEHADGCGTGEAGYDGYINGADAVLIGQGMVYVSFIDQGSYLDAFDAATGTMKWSHTGVLESVLPGALVIYENPTSCEVWPPGCDIPDTADAYFDVRNPQTGAHYWSYHANDITSFLVATTP